MSKQGGKGDSKKKQAGLFSRLIVILFALAMVVLGSETLQKEYGGVMNYLKVQSRALASQVRKVPSELEEAPITTLDVAPAGKRIGVETPAAAKPKLDGLGDQDRQQLDQLLNGL